MAETAIGTSSVDADEWETEPDAQPETGAPTRRTASPVGARGTPIRRQAAAPARHNNAADRSAPAPELCYPCLDDWFQDYFTSAYRRSFLGPQHRWCAQWWRHPEAVSRLDAMWRAWEHLRLDPALGMSVWWREHADTHMAALTHPDGTFKGCRPGDASTPAVHSLQEPLAHQQRPRAPLAPPSGLGG